MEAHSELESSNDANSKLQEGMDIMMTEKRLEQTEIIEHMRIMPQVIKQMLFGPQKTHPLGWQGTDP